MTQVADILRDALGHLRVTDANGPLDENDAADGISALNRMMRLWEVEGLSLGWQDVSEPTQDMPTPPEADEAIGAGLALRLASKYGKPVDPGVAAMAANGESSLRAQIASNTLLRVVYPDLPDGEGQPFGWHRGWRNGLVG
jgi:hypothetical protein